MVKYEWGKIYKVVNDANDSIYIGSTCQKYLSTRMTDHKGHVRHPERRKSSLYQDMRKLGVEHFKIILIRNFACNNKAELEAEEYRTMKEYKAQGQQLYNEAIDGTRDERSKGRIRGSNNPNFKRGYVGFENSNRSSCWRFRWMEDGKLQSQSFSVKRYSYDGAHGLALWAQDEKYPTEPIE
jgi:hypothetical protein